MAAFKISRTSRLEPWFRVTDLPRRSDPAARCERDSHSAGWMSTACALRRVFSSFGLSSLGRSAESDERHPACQNPSGGRGFSVPPLVLFSRRDSSPRRPGRWLNQQLGHQLVLTATYSESGKERGRGSRQQPCLCHSDGLLFVRGCWRLWFLYSAHWGFFLGRGDSNPLPAPTCEPLM